MILQVLIPMVAGWINRHQQYVITYLKEENRGLTSKLPGGRLRLNDTEHRRLAKLAIPLSRQQLRDTATIATPDTLMRWYNQLIASKFDGGKERNGPGRPRVDAEIEQLVVRDKGGIGARSRYHFATLGKADNDIVDVRTFACVIERPKRTRIRNRS